MRGPRSRPPAMPWWAPAPACQTLCGSHVAKFFPTPQTNNHTATRFVVDSLWPMLCGYPPMDDRKSRQHPTGFVPLNSHFCP